MKVYLNLFTLFILCLLASACDNFNEEPMYLRINEADFRTEADEGAPSHRIQDVWVYADGLSIGVFELPADVPVLSSDSDVDIDIFGGIRNNGLALSPTQYSFYERIDFTQNFEPGTTVEVSPIFAYREGAKIAFLEDFEGSNLFSEDLDGDDTSVLVKTSDPAQVKYGFSCGRISLNTENNLFQQATLATFNAEDFGASEVFVELDFKCDIPFVFGYVGQSGSFSSTRFPIVLNPTEEWTKIYIDYSVFFNGGEFESYKLLLAGAPLEEGGTIWVDNIKLVYNDN